jgi:hypothetical protein
MDQLGKFELKLAAGAPGTCALLRSFITHLQYGDRIRAGPIFSLAAGCVMGQILPFSRREKAFDADATAVLIAAYERAMVAIEGRNHPGVMREVAARRIIALASKGERDPDRLCAAALATIANAVTRMPEPPIRIAVAIPTSVGSGSV